MRAYFKRFEPYLFTDPPTALAEAPRERYLIALTGELGVRMIACEMPWELMGIKESELVAGLECGGVASFLADSLKSRTNLCI